MLAQSRTENRERSRLFHFNMDRPWYVVVTLPAREAIATDGLRANGFLACFPQERRSVRINAVARREQLYPIIPGYVFVSFESADAWQKIYNVFGVRTVLTYGERPVPVPTAVMEHLRDREADLASVRVSRYRPIDVRAGSWVQVVEHPSFSGLFGRVTHTNNRTQMVMVEIDLFGRLTPVMMPVDKVRLV